MMTVARCLGGGQDRIENAWSAGGYSVRLTYDGDGLEVPVCPDKTLLEHSLEHDVAHANGCGGKGRCSTCRVIILDGLDNLCKRNDTEQKLADKRGFTPEVRLACQSRAHGPVRLRRLICDELDLQLSGLAVGAREMSVAIMFVDIREFTAFSERHLPYDIVHILNRYFEVMGSVIIDNGGIIDKYIGDGLMATFGLGGGEGPEICRCALDAAMCMVEALESFNDYLSEYFGEQFEIGVGIHYGTVVTGDLGHSGTRQCTVVGDAVNVAARAESATKEVAEPILVSKAVVDELGAEDWTEYRMELKGKSDVALLYGVSPVAAQRTEE